MDHAVTARHKWRNLLHTLLLVGGMSLLLAVCSELLFGEGVWPWVLATVAVLMFVLSMLGLLTALFSIPLMLMGTAAGISCGAQAKARDGSNPIIPRAQPNCHIIQSNHNDLR